MNSFKSFLQESAQKFDDSDIIKVGRLANPNGWYVQLQNERGESLKVKNFYGTLSMMEAIAKARGNSK